MGAWIDRISLGEKFTLDKAYADIFYSMDIPFRFADSPALETFIKFAQPAYAPPTAKAIAGPLLNHAHQDMMAKMNQLVQDQTRISLVSDGWTSLRNDHMVNFVAVFPNKSVNLVFDIKGSTSARQKKNEFSRIVEDATLWSNLEALVVLLRPTCTIIDKLESDSCCLLDVYHVFLQLREHWHSNVELTELKINPDRHHVLVEIAAFVDAMKNPSTKARSFIEECVTLMTYWHQVGSTKFPALYVIAQTVFSVPTSQAAAERVWSIYEFILTKRRNRLNPDKVSMLF
ncbi:hypothetical protein DYB31_010634 [Aphanomyces astaci]|uniref:HAT C-terminal dimerisation domain-containing protein n=1 Tax=Aphanomyces astaci TaxID=112090 RepID=A0A397EZ78_APHAT|nr:hypothetical protein DYB31_010634 [Aphanomyces astaci]